MSITRDAERTGRGDEPARSRAQKLRGLLLTLLATTSDQNDTPASGDVPSSQEFTTALLAKLRYDVGKDPAVAQPSDWLRALSYAIRDRVVDTWIASTRDTYATGAKRVYYLSMEFLVG